jgi:hypothetical protein
MADLWPSDLPQKLNVQGHQYTFGDISIRSNPSVGPSKVRPRSSAIASPLQGMMYLTTAQLQTLETFYKITVRGSDVFLFPDPEGFMPGVATSPTPMLYCRFTGSPSISATSAAGMWAVGLPMEVIP